MLFFYGAVLALFFRCSFHPPRILDLIPLISYSHHPLTMHNNTLSHTPLLYEPVKGRAAWLDSPIQHRGRMLASCPALGSFFALSLFLQPKHWAFNNGSKTLSSVLSWAISTWPTPLPLFSCHNSTPPSGALALGLGALQMFWHISQVESSFRASPFSHLPHHSFPCTQR